MVETVVAVAVVVVKKKEEPEPEPADKCCNCFDEATHSCPVCKQIVGVSQTCDIWFKI